MTKSKPGIVFMGTPQFAVPSLEILLDNNYPVRAVITAPDKPAGRGLQLRESPVKKTAISRGIEVLQPSNLKNDAFVKMLREFSADLFAVVAFRMLPEKVWSIPPLGTVNLHASLLPLYRGAAPINHAIINGEEVTGVTTFLIEQEIDKGKILLQEKTEIDEFESAGNLHDRLMQLGARLLLETIAAISEGKIVPKPQDEIISAKNLPAAPRIRKNDCRINWSSPAEKIFNLVRGLSPYPAAWTTIMTGNRAVNLKIFEVEKLIGSHPHSPGKVVSADKDFVVAAADGFIIIRKIQAEGRKPMEAHEFLKGFRPDGRFFFE